MEDTLSKSFGFIATGLLAVVLSSCGTETEVAPPPSGPSTPTATTVVPRFHEPTLCHYHTCVQ